MLTRRGAGLLFGAVLLWAIGRFLGVSELYVVAAATGLLVVVGAVAVRLSTATIAVRRSVTQDRILQGGTGEAVVQLRNDSRFPTSLLLVEDTSHRALADQPRFVVPGLGAGRTASLRYPLQGRVRGRYPVGPLRVRVRDPFGLTQRVRRYRGVDEVVVYPRIESLGEGVGLGAHLGSGASDLRRLFTSGDEFYTMREYVTGDDLRQVHWPSTAHRQTLMVRQQEQPWQVEATVLCDTRHGAHRDIGRDSPLEKAISVAASLVWHLADDGYRLRLVTEADQRTPALAPWQAHLDRLAEVAPTRVPALGPALQGLRGAASEGLLMAVIAPPPGDEPVARCGDTKALLQAGRGFSARAALIVSGSGRAGPGGSDRAESMAALLRAAGWKATTIAPSQALGDRWRLLTGGRPRAAAYQPGAAS